MKTQITLPIEVNIEIEKTVFNLKRLLQDNKPFAKTLLDNSLLLGKGVFKGNIEGLIDREYDHLDEYAPFRTELGDIVWKLGSLIYGNDPLIRKEIGKVTREEWAEQGNKIREEVEKTINYIFDQPDPAVITTGPLGESIQFNDF